LDGGEEVDVGGVGGEGDDVDHFVLGGGGARLRGWVRLVLERGGGLDA
jgi:hypothetical protein